MRETILEICNMKNPLCAQGIEKQLSNLPSVHSVHSNPINGTTAVHHDEDTISLEKLKQEVDKMGLYCHCEALPAHYGRKPIEVAPKEKEPFVEMKTNAHHPEIDHETQGEQVVKDHAEDVAHEVMDHVELIDHEAMDHAADVDHEAMDHAVEDHAAHGGHGH